MASRFKNIVKLFGDLKARTIIIVTAMIIIFGLIIGFLNYKRALVGPAASSQVEAIPSALKSIPGQQNQNIEYAKLQERENLEKVERAFQQGTSAIPTIIQTTATNKLSTESSKEPENIHALALVSVKQSHCSIEALQNAKRVGATASELQQLGCTAEQLSAAGYSATDLLKAGFSLDDLKRLGYGLDALRNAGVCSCDLKHAGYSAVQLKQAGFSAADLKCACFTDAELAQAGFPSGASLRSMFAEGCDPDRLAKARAQGASPVELRRMGCSAIQLQQLGLTASELKQAGYSPEELKAAGFTAGELLAAGYTAQQLKQAGYSAQDLRNAGFNPKELKDVGYTTEQLKAAGYTPGELKRAGYSEEELTAAGMVIKPDAKIVDCSIVSLTKAKQAGRRAAEIRENSGCDASALQQAGYSLAELKEAGFTAGELKKAGFSLAELKQAGFSALDLKNAGFTPGELSKVGFTASELKQAGFSAGALKSVGFSAAELKDAGFNAGELKRVGFTPEQLKQAGFSAKELADAGFSIASLKEAGVTPAELKQAGFNAKQLRDAGFTAKAIQDAGFSEQDLQEAGYTSSQLVQAGIAPGLEMSDGFSRKGSIPDAVLTAGTEDRQIAALAAQQQLQFNEQQFKQSQQEILANMQGQAQQLFGKWTAVANQTLVVGEADKDIAATRGGVGGSAASGGAYNPGAIMTKAGTVMFAVLDTAVNSDEPGPIMATIVEGAFKGGKLLGTLQVFGRDADRVMLSFNKLVLPNMPKSMGVNAFAIDPNTARTALSSETDHHYLLRYGSLFAASFLQGYGQAVVQSGSVDIESANGSSQKRFKEFSTGDLAAAGLGQVGMVWGSQLGNIFTRPPTIHVYAGTSVGILFQDDVQSTQ
ncbi:MAG: icmE dotG [Gammaproteobacteria bacterium]|jgi:intracellular multiplication protein IcmE|nr:icmE dotG [Gammaproteobacteria bacterium]